jgi:hypothetical protein
MADVDMYTDQKIICILETLKLKGLGMKLVNRTGQVFGKLTVLEQAGRNSLKKVLWRCQCECGKELVAVSGSLVTGNTTSCGCVTPNFKHGGTGKGSYNTWRAMMRRCYNKSDKDFKKYGALGVSVYAPWRDYLAFASDMGEPSGNQTLDRIDVYGNYTPNNCRWATPTVQSRNLRVRKTSASGFTGVHMRKGKWYAEITVQKKKFYSGACITINEAVVARKKLEHLHWGVA